MVKVVKFGGSSLADAEQFRKVAEIIKSEDSRRYVVASAPGKRYDDDIKVTDMLYSCYKLVKENKDIDEAFKLIEDRYNGIIKDLGLDFWLQPEFDRIKNAIVHHAGRDYIASRGEYLNSMILAKYIGYDFIDAEDGIFFKENGTLDTEMKDKFACSNIYTKEGCKDCWCKFYCSGGCNANNYSFNKDINKPVKLSCEMERKRVECAIMIKVAMADK